MANGIGLWYNQRSGEMNEKQLKQEIRRLKKVKLACRSGSKERIKLHRQIKTLKKKLEYQSIKDQEKTLIIKEIIKFKPHRINLYKFTVKELKYHLNKLKRGDIK